MTYEWNKNPLKSMTWCLTLELICPIIRVWRRNVSVAKHSGVGK